MTGTGRKGANNGGDGEDQPPVTGNGSGMTVELPPGLQKFFKVTMGMTWPEASEKGLLDMSGAWETFHKAARAAVEASNDWVPRARRSIKGVTAADLDKYLSDEQKGILAHLKA